MRKYRLTLILSCVLSLLIIVLVFNIFENKNKIISEQWFYEKMNISHYEQNKNINNEIKIALIDSGINDKIYDYIKEENIVERFNAFDMSDDVNDEFGHGTQLATLLLGDTISHKGIALDAKVVIIKVINSFGNTDNETLLNGVRHAIDINVDIINLSLGSLNINADLENLIIEGQNKGIIFLSSIGDSGLKKIYYPANYNEVLAIGTIDSKGRIGLSSNYSNEKTIIYFPGIDIDVPVVSLLGELNFQKKSGSSYSCVIASGILTLVLQERKMNIFEVYNLLTDFNVYTNNIIDMKKIMLYLRS